VLQIETETDIERLRQVALLQQAELDRLHQRLAALTAALAAARGEEPTAALQLELLQLQEQLAARTRALFGPSSEQRPDPRRDAASGERIPPRGHGPRAQPRLPIVEVVHTLDPPDETCPQCGGHLEVWKDQYEEADEIDVVERSFRVVRGKRQKYRCRCGGCVETALGPPKLTAGGRYSIAFGVAVAIAKYADHLPLARQVKQMARAGLTTDTQTLWDQLAALAHHLTPTHDALHAYVLLAPVVGADETRWPLLGHPGATKWHAWALAAPDAICYRIADSRAVAAAAAVLRDYQGWVIADGYSVYTALRARREAAGPGTTFQLAHCWAHARRKYVEAAPFYPQAADVLALIGQLYAIDARVQDPPALERLARRAELRQAESTAVVAEIRRWCTTQPVLPESALGKAIRYTLDLWAGLTAFLTEPALPLDTNHVERGLRALAVGRKNHYGSRSERGTRVAALFYSLIRVGEARGGRAGHLPRRGDPPRHRHARHRHAARRAPPRVATPPSRASLAAIVIRVETGHGEHLRATATRSPRSPLPPPPAPDRRQVRGVTRSPVSPALASACARLPKGHSASRRRSLAFNAVAEAPMRSRVPRGHRYPPESPRGDVPHFSRRRTTHIARGGTQLARMPALPDRPAMLEEVGRIRLFSVREQFRPHHLAGSLRRPEGDNRIPPVHAFDAEAR
jgi:transposase